MKSIKKEINKISLVSTNVNKNRAITFEVIEHIQLKIEIELNNRTYDEFVKKKNLVLL